MSHSIPVTAADIVVIGAGPAGLAVSACLTHAGLPHQVLERTESIGSSWRRHYDRLHLHTVKQLSALPFTPWPRTAARYPARDAVVEYLESYARAHGIAPRFGVEVRRLVPHPSGPILDTSAGRLRPRVVVVATGLNAEPVIPDVPGLASFEGTAVHSRDYRNPDPYRGRRVAVVGCGNSGAEIALDLAEHGIDVAMVVRGPVHVVPREVFGRSTQQTALLLGKLPAAVRDRLIPVIQRVTVGDLTRWGIARPKTGLTDSVAAGRIPLIDVGTIAAIRDGRVRVLPALAEVRPHAVVLADGRVMPADALIFATGYRPGLAAWIDGFATIADDRGRPPGIETTWPGIYFVGFTTRPTGALREISLEAPAVARAIRARLDPGG